ncbi:hypothetical protein LOAG_11546 [Loa loa]|uniref:Uncharacterized protein n=1 Tax=Loa loa TaxID=7209 RepID=A0A1S0TMV1_LOALO|nr:hypothetical protein LOAG_11546 [Loa loa]EFO16958.1 hypothetical protein LOAG_11546 [Loa loa]
MKNSNANLAISESINMNDNSNSIGSIGATDVEKAITIADTDFIPNENKNVTNETEKVLSKVQNVKLLDPWQNNDEAKRDEKQQSKMQLETFEQTTDETKCKQKEDEQKSPSNHITNTNLTLQKKLRKSKSIEHTESSEISLESQKSTNMIISVKPEKGIEMLQTDEKMMKNFENIGSTNTKVMNVSQSLSETSLRTMWELFKQGTWKQSSRPSC